MTNELFIFLAAPNFCSAKAIQVESFSIIVGILKCSLICFFMWYNFDCLSKESLIPFSVSTKPGILMPMPKKFDVGMLDEVINSSVRPIMISRALSLFFSGL
ncbi:hypothetical protein D3C87_1461910 [compost metagenome]